MRRHTRGFSLIELLVGASVALLTLLAVAAAFIAFYRNVYTQEGQRAGQASIRNSVHGLARQLRMAGYGLEPFHAFGFPAGWRSSGPNNSDRLIIRSRDPLFSASVTAASATQVKVSRLPISLRQGQIIQVVCPGGYDWGYGQLAADVAAANVETTLQLEPATPGTFPRLNDVFDRTCFDGALPSLPAMVFKVDSVEYSIADMEDDNNAATPPVRPFLFRSYGLGPPPVGGTALGEPVAEGIEALRFTFLDANGKEIATPDPTAARPTYDTPENDALRSNANPANIRAVRVGVVARASSPDPVLQQAVMETTIPGFANRAAISNAPPGFRRTLFEMTVYPRNMRSSQMPVPTYSTDTTPQACTGKLPADGLVCAGG